VTPRDSVTITTTTREGVYFVDTASASVVPEMIPNGMTMPSPEILRTNNLINKKVAWVFSFKTSKNVVPRGGYLTISIPRDVMLPIEDSTLDVINYDTMGRYWNTTIRYYTATPLSKTGGKGI
jgi:hypothetical protein